LSIFVFVLEESTFLLIFGKFGKLKTQFSLAAFGWRMGKSLAREWESLPQTVSKALQDIHQLPLTKK